jgi:prepilin-type N-terminal cleavage/methylation domain-containing protein
MDTKGFTLLELMLVIAVISILTVPSITSLGRVLGKGRSAAATASVKAYATGIALFKAENNYYPATSGPTISCIGAPGVSACTFTDWTFTTPNDAFHALNTLVPNYMPTLKWVDTGRLKINRFYYEGATYNCGFYRGSQCYEVSLMWPVVGDKCSAGKTLETDGLNALCELVL